MRVETDAGSFDLGETEATPTIGITDYSRRVTDAFGVTTVVKRDFSRHLSVKLGVPFDQVDSLQRRLADLRATSARWIADSSLAWLSAEGFYKDFSIDLAVPPLSYCTLTVEGIAETETVADVGEDPAVDGDVSTLRILQPTEVTDAIFTSSTYEENDYAQWSAATTYPLAARVIKTATHRIYESAIGGNFNHDPAGDSGQWIDIGPTNRWAMFDQALGTATLGVGGLAFVITPTVPTTAVALLDVVGLTAYVQAPGVDINVPVENGTATFLDLNVAAGQPITVTVLGTAGQPIAIGTAMLGRIFGLGVTEASPTAGITDYSLKGTDDFGTVTPIERAWAKKMGVKALIRTDAVDIVANRIASVRAQPSLWIGDADVDALTVYGFFKDFSIEIGENVSKLALSIEGLSKAAPLPVPPTVYVPRGDYRDDLTYDAGNVAQFEGSSWEWIFGSAASGHAPPSLPTTSNTYWRIFARAGDDGRDGLNGTNGTPGAPGNDGLPTYLHLAYSNSADGTADFTTAAPGARKYLGLLVNHTVADSQNPASYTWSLIKGADGLNGTNGTPGAPGANGQPTYVHIAYSNSANGSQDFSTDDPTGRTYVGFYVDQTLADSTNPAAYAWSLVKGADGAGANKVVLSNFAQGLRGFRPGATYGTVTPYASSGGFSTTTPPGVFERNINLNGWFGSRQVPYAHFAGTLSNQDFLECFWTPSQWSGDTFASGLGYMMPVKPGDKVYARCLAAEHRCHFVMYLLIFDGTGALVSAPQFDGARPYGAANGDPADFNVVGGIVQPMPANAAWAALMFRFFGTGEVDPYIFFTEPAMGLVGEGQTTLPPYSDGPSDPLADITALNQHTVAQVSDIVIQADYQGNQAQGSFPASRSFNRLLGPTDVSASTSYSLTLTGGLAGSIDNTPGSQFRGTLTMTGGVGGYIVVTSVYLGISIDTTIAISTVLAAAPAPGGGGCGSGGGATPGGAASTSTFASPNMSTSYVLLATLDPVSVGSAGSVMLGTSISYHQQNSAGSYGGGTGTNVTAPDGGGGTNAGQDDPPDTTLIAKVTRSVNGGGETDVFTAAGSIAQKYFKTVAPGKGLKDFPGYLSDSRNDGGLPGGASVVYRIYGVADPATYGLNALAGTFSATPNG